MPSGPRIKLTKRTERPPAAQAPEPLDPHDPDLQEDLEVACMDALRGDPPGPAVARRLELVCKRVMDQYGASGARITATSTRQGTAVRILLPQPDETVREVRLQLG